MSNNRSNLTVFCILFVAVALFIGCSSDDKTLKISPSKLDFGSVNIGDTFDIEVTMTNKYGKDVTVTNLDISGSTDFLITSGGTIPFNLINKAEHKFTVTFTPSVGGQIAAVLFITHDASTKTKDVDLMGVGVPVARIELSDKSFDFDKRLINKTHTHDLDIENFGTADLQINNLSFTGLGASVYSMAAGSTAPFNVSPGSTKTVTIELKPILAGMYDANLEIHHNAVNENSPLVYPISAEAIDVDPQITLSRTSPWDLGSVAKTIPSTQICAIENTGRDPLTVTSASLATGTTIIVDSLKDANGNVINFPQIIAVASKIMLAIKFSPTANTTYNDTLTLIHDGTNEVSPFDIALTGDGRDEITKTFTYSGAPVNWTVPAGVSVIIGEAWGAQGEGGYGGKGARIKGTCVVTPGDTLEIFAGGRIGYACGGDASYIANGATVMIMAGAAGGSRYSYAAGRPGAITENGTKSNQSSSNYIGGDAGTGGNGGKGGPGSWGTGGGGGWLSAGGNASGTTGGAIKGKGSDGTTYAGGAGGGYSGGGGCAMASGWSTAGGGSGGSKNTGTNQSNTAGTRSGNGEVKITY